MFIGFVHVLNSDLEDAGRSGKRLRGSKQRAFDAFSPLGRLFRGNLHQRGPNPEVNVFSGSAGRR
jgi:hypothetical protein